MISARFAIYSLIISLPVLLMSCKKMTQPEKDEVTISDYVSYYNLDAYRTSTGLYVVIDNPGTARAQHLALQV